MRSAILVKSNGQHAYAISPVLRQGDACGRLFLEILVNQGQRYLHKAILHRSLETALTLQLGTLYCDRMIGQECVPMQLSEPRVTQCT
jgi:hypothetical protein